MDIRVREHQHTDLPEMLSIWNEIVADGLAFPQEEILTPDSARSFFNAQSFCGIAEDTQIGRILGLYILHPNNIGRCGHIANASYAVQEQKRGFGIGEVLVRHSLEVAASLGFRILQFNAVVEDNIAAHKLYNKLGFTRLGTVPGGFRRENGNFMDISLYYHEL